MKSPWKLFAELTSRQRTQAKPGPPVTTDRQPDVADKETLRVQLVIGHKQARQGEDGTSKHGLEASTAAPIDADEMPVVLPNAVSETAEREIAEFQALPAEPEKLADEVKAPATEAKTKKRENAAGKHRTVSATPSELVAENSDRDPSSPPASRAVELELDDEIKQLRRQLAEKLRNQNAQLKTMLERF